MAADTYTDWELIYSSPASQGIASDTEWVAYIGHNNATDFYYDPVNEVWLHAWYNDSGTDYIMYIDYSDSATLSSSTTWTTCTTNLPTSNSADYTQGSKLAYDPTNDHWIIHRVTRDNSVSEDDFALDAFTFNGTDITVIDASHIYAVDQTTNTMMRSIVAPNTAASSGLGEDADTWVISPSQSNTGFTYIFTNYIDNSADIYVSQSGENDYNMNRFHGYVGKHGANGAAKWWDTADLYNTSDAEILSIAGRASDGDLYADYVKYNTTNDQWQTGGTKSKISDAGVDLTTATLYVGGTYWYDYNVSKWFVWAQGSVAASSDCESVLYSGTAYNSWTQETSPDSLINARSDTNPNPKYHNHCYAYQDGTAIVSYINNDIDQVGVWMKYDSGTDTWSDVFSITPATSGHDCVYAGISSDGAWAYAVIYHVGDDQHYIYKRQFNSAPNATFTEPEDGSAIQSRNAVTLKWTYSDDDSDPQAHYRIKRVIDATTTTYWDGGTSSWVSTEAAGTKIASSSAQFQLNANWGDASTETSHAYSIQVWDDQGQTAGYTDTVTIYPSSSVSTVKGYSLPRPIKRQADINTTLRSNQDYSVSWINSYVPAYGDLNDDLYLKGGLRPSSTTRMRNMYPPVVGSFSLGNASNYFQDVAATNIYRTNELALSSARAKKFRQLRDKQLLKMVLEVPVEEFTYKDERLNGDTGYRYGLVAEDVIYWLNRNRMDQNDYSFFSYHEDANGELLPYLHSDQLVPVLWKAVQELYELVESVLPPGQALSLEKIDENIRRRDRE